MLASFLIPFKQENFKFEQQQIKVAGTIVHTQKCFMNWSFSAKLCFLTQWLNAPWLNEHSKQQPFALNGLEGSPVLEMQRILKHWKMMSKKIEQGKFYVEFEQTRQIFERNLMKELKYFPMNDKLAHAVELLKVINRSNCFSAPNPRRVNELKNFITKQRIKKLNNFKEWFGTLSLRVQTRVLNFLSKKKKPLSVLNRQLNPFNQLIFRVKQVSAQLSKIGESSVKNRFINDVMQLHQVKQQEVTHQYRQALSTRWGSAPSAPSSPSQVARLLDSTIEARLRPRRLF